MSVPARGVIGIIGTSRNDLRSYRDGATFYSDLDRTARGKIEIREDISGIESG
jgi:hypothetical protein